MIRTKIPSGVGYLEERIAKTQDVIGDVIDEIRALPKPMSEEDDSFWQNVRLNKRLELLKKDLKILEKERDSAKSFFAEMTLLLEDVFERKWVEKMEELGYDENHERKTSSTEYDVFGNPR